MRAARTAPSCQQYQRGQSSWSEPSGFQTNVHSWGACDSSIISPPLFAGITVQDLLWEPHLPQHFLLALHSKLTPKGLYTQAQWPCHLEPQMLLKGFLSQRLVRSMDSG